jgi:hypothetical protein
MEISRRRITMARLAADKIAERRNRAASPRDHVDGCVAGGRSENTNSTS